jgi:hypothetical protein
VWYFLFFLLLTISKVIIYIQSKIR